MGSYNQRKAKPALAAASRASLQFISETPVRREGQTLIAAPEKAILDMIYIVSKGLRRIEFEDLDYSPINKRDFHKMCKRIDYRPFINKLKKIGI